MINKKKSVLSGTYPQATNGELKELLQNVVPALKAHLEHAQIGSLIVK